MCMYGHNYNEILLCFIVFIRDMYSPSHNAVGRHQLDVSISITIRVLSFCSTGKNPNQIPLRLLSL